MNAGLDFRGLMILALAFSTVVLLAQALWILFGSRWRLARRISDRWAGLRARAADSPSTRPGGDATSGETPGSASSRAGTGWSPFRIWQRRRRLEQLQPQLADAVELIARALRAGHGLPMALRMVAQDGPQPIAGEFSITCDQIGLGVPADEALRNLALRNPCDDLRCLVIAVVLQRETGGNLAEVLDGIASLVRQRQRLRQSVRALSAEGRLSAWILSLLPFALAGAIALINPQLLSVLWTDPAGRMMSAISLAMVFGGILLMRTIVRVRA